MLSNCSWALSRLDASVDKNPVGREESFVLTVVADDEVESSRLNTSALMRNFLVGRTSLNRSTRIINFDSHKETRWQILLTPRNTGALQIPAFTIDGVSSAPITLTVSDQENVDRTSSTLFVSSELLHSQVYLGQMALYKVKLYLAVDLQRGELSVPNIEGGRVKQLGEDKELLEIVEGRRYRVIERVYGITADKPGRLAITPPVFEGDALVPARGNGGMFSFNESRPVQATGKEQFLVVKDKPESWQGNWFVADLVALKEEFPEDIEEFALGTPITRTITLLASNADDTGLPSLTSQLPAELKSYPEKPEVKTFLRDEQLVVQLRLTEAIVPSEIGTFELPAIEVPWWNPHLAKRELAIIPARTIRVTGVMPQTLPPMPAIQNGMQTSSGYWPWIAAFFALGWLLTAVAWFSSRRCQMQDNETVSAPAHSAAKLALVQACSAGDGKAMLNMTQAYLSAQTGDNITLERAKALSPQLAAALDDIQQALYSKHSGSIDGAPLLTALNTLPLPAKADSITALKPLNP
ncbi:BatD family protein [Shewanella sp.]|uniref:BatD family protein n=1 Tax=Shewanella sp. TaxID=50422 RepID=UPI0035628316